MRMHWGWTVLVAITLAAPSAFAGPPPAPYTWTGCYVGGNIGYAWGRDDGYNATPTTTFFGLGIPVTGPIYGGTNLGGAVFGVQDGCNYQAGLWVIGLEGDFNGMVTQQGQAPDVSAQVNRAAVAQTSEVWLATLRARLGVTGFDNRALFYATGGGALMNLTSMQVVTGFVSLSSNSQTDWPFGWTVGGGLEYAFTDYFLLRAEYLYVRIPAYNTFTANSGYLGGPPVPLSTSLSENIFRFGISYKFSDRILFFLK